MSSKAEMLAQRDLMRAERDRQRGTAVVLVTGPPCSGKTQYVREHMEHGDLVIDYDALAVALGSTDTHDHPRQLLPFVLHACDAVLDRVNRDRELRRAWLIKCDPSDQDRRRATDVVTLDVPPEVCKERAEAAGRPERWAALIDAWHERNRTKGGG